jgi:hypothetical protein
MKSFAIFGLYNSILAVIQCSQQNSHDPESSGRESVFPAHTAVPVQNRKKQVTHHPAPIGPAIPRKERFHG